MRRICRPGRHGDGAAGALFTLAALLFNTNGANVAWTLAGETNTLVAPAEIRVAANTATLATVLAAMRDCPRPATVFWN
jgi:hypothetical protein